MGDALVHIGTHKTGTTSFQRWVHDHRETLLGRGIHVFEGRYGVSNVALPLLCARSNRSMPPQRLIMDSWLDEWRTDLTEYVQRQVAHPAPQLLVSAEDLSLLRFPDEVERLAKLLAPRVIRIAVCLRDPEDFLESYRAEMNRLDEPESTYRDSHTYYGEDAWLIRWDEMLSTWRSVLGDENVTAVSYERAMSEHGTTIPGVLKALDIPLVGLPSWERYRANVTAKAQRRQEWANLYAQARRTASSTWLGRTVIMPLRKRAGRTRESTPR